MIGVHNQKRKKIGCCVLYYSFFDEDLVGYIREKGYNLGLNVKGEFGLYLEKVEKNNKKSRVERKKTNYRKRTIGWGKKQESIYLII